MRANSKPCDWIANVGDIAWLKPTERRASVAAVAHHWVVQSIVKRPGCAKRVADYAVSTDSIC